MKKLKKMLNFNNYQFYTKEKNLKVSHDFNILDATEVTSPRAVKPGGGLLRVKTINTWRPTWRMSNLPSWWKFWTFLQQFHNFVLFVTFCFISDTMF